MKSVLFFSHYASFKKKFSSIFKNSLLDVFNKENQFYKEIVLSFHFFSDKDLLRLNREILNHDFYTDIITCPIIQSDTVLEADIYISLDRVYDNAKLLNSTFNQELNRVLLHGILHLCGYKDKTLKEEEVMRLKENFYLDKCFT